MPEVYVAGKKEDVPEGGGGLAEQLKSEKIKSAPGGLFSAYLVGPTWVSFDTKEPQEKIILLLRGHWVTNVPWVVGALVMMVVPLMLSVFPALSFLPLRFQVMAVLFWYLLTLAFIFEQFLGWFYNIYIVTDQRVVDIDFINLIYRQVDAARMTHIENVSIMQGGMIQALFNYGMVFIQTAAEVENIEFEKVPNPAAVVKTINLIMPDITRPGVQ
jgi:hypothetical protein